MSFAAAARTEPADSHASSNCKSFACCKSSSVTCGGGAVQPRDDVDGSGVQDMAVELRDRESDR
jgi:hypothetical protein